MKTKTYVPDPAGNILELLKKKTKHFCSFVTFLLGNFQLVAVISSANFPVELSYITKGDRKNYGILHSALLQRKKEMEQKGTFQLASLLYHYYFRITTGCYDPFLPIF